MDKDEYREEVLKQLKEQNENLSAIGAMLFFILLGIIALIIIELFMMNDITRIRLKIDNIQNYVYDISSSVDAIKSSTRTWLEAIYKQLCAITYKVY